MDRFKLIKNSTYGYSSSDDVDYLRYSRDWFFRRGSSILDLMEENSMIQDDTERPLKLKDIDFCKPIRGLISARPNTYGVVSIHNIAGYEISILRYEDTSMDTLWYTTPMWTRHCKIANLEERIHEDLLALISEELKWKNLK